MFQYYPVQNPPVPSDKKPIPQNDNVETVETAETVETKEQAENVNE